jgi:hypothetical protein
LYVCIAIFQAKRQHRYRNPGGGEARQPLAHAASRPQTVQGCGNCRRFSQFTENAPPHRLAGVGGFELPQAAARHCLQQIWFV